MLFEHAAEVISIGEAAIFRDLFDGLVRVAEEVTGAVEAVAEEHAHGSHPHLGTEEVIQVSHAHPCRA